MTALEDRILILDGAMGTMIQKYGLAEDDYRGDIFAGYGKELRGNNECLNLTRPDIIKAIHKEYIEAGADIIETNTFNANRISQAEYGCQKNAGRMASEGARLAREAADCAMNEGCGRKIWVAGSVGPTSKSLSLSPDVADPGFRAYSFDQMYQAYREQAEGLIRGGVDLILIETCFDALNVKCALKAISDCQEGEDEKIPVIISVSVSDRSGRTLTGQTLEAFYTSVRHAGPVAFGLNCSLGAAELMPLVEDMNKWCRCRVSCYPNAGLPNEMGEYDQSPEEMAGQIRIMASRGLVSIVGGCCGTTPEHIRAIAEAVRDLRPSIKTGISVDKMPLKVSGLETVTVDVKHNNFTNVGERTNVAGSRKFARLIAEGNYDQALQIAARQIEDGAGIIDINMDDAMLDSTVQMERFVRYISNDPAVAKAALMIDSSHWETILAGLKNAQGKCIVNSISLKEGPEAFVQKAKTIRSFGAAIVVMAFDEQGQATTYDRKIEICRRAYDLLVNEAGILPSDIIFDVNILSIGTGIEEHSMYAVDFIEAVRWIKENLPGALTSGGVSNLSFAFRGNNAVREAMHSAFLYHAIKAGLDMAIVNPSMLQIYDEIEPELLRCVEDVIFNRDAEATERLIEKATELKEMSVQAVNDGQKGEIAQTANEGESVEVRLKNALVKGKTDCLEADIRQAIEEYGSAVSIIEGPLMAGMETVGRLFGDGKMFLPQVVKSAKVMRDAVALLEPYMDFSETSCSQNDCQDRRESATGRPKIVLATVKGDVHDIGKNITGIVLTCNGFDVHDLGVMVDKERILDEAERIGASLVAVSGLITPSLFQMEEICREMTARGMDLPLFIGGATTSAVHTAVKLAPLYDHVFYGPDASSAAVMAKKCMMDREAFEQEQHVEQEKMRKLYLTSSDSTVTSSDSTVTSSEVERSHTSVFPYDSYPALAPADIPVCELSLDKVLSYFDWKMFYAIWGVKYGSAVPEAMELIQLRRDAEDELALEDFRIMVSARFFSAYSSDDALVFEYEGKDIRLPMFRQEGGKGLSLGDFVIHEESGKRSPFGIFAISVHKKSKAHVQGCSCPACSNAYEDMIGRTVRMTLAEAASIWLDGKIRDQISPQVKVIRPAAGYSSCPDHTLKGDILRILCGHVHIAEECHCGCHHEEGLGIGLTESYAMTPESSICGMIFMHPQACYPEIRRISRQQYERYSAMRGMDQETARRFLGHLLK